MANQTQIQWAHSTTNPVMGCDGCELYPTIAQIRRLILLIACSHGADAAALGTLLDALLAPSAQGVKLRLGEIDVYQGRLPLEGGRQGHDGGQDRAECELHFHNSFFSYLKQQKTL